MRAVYALTLRQLSGKWRLLIMTVLAFLPVILTTAMLAIDDTVSVAEFDTLLLSSMLLGSILPLIVLAIAGAAFGNELDDRTLANLTISPVPRWKIALPKLLATMTIAGPFIAMSAFLTAYIGFLGDTRAAVAVVVAVIAGVAMYASLFVWLGLVTSQAIGIGLLYIVIWEGFFCGFLFGLRMLSIRFYAIALMHAIDPRRFAGDDHVGTTWAVLAAVIVTGGFLALTIRRLRRMDIP